MYTASSGNERLTEIHTVYHIYDILGVTTCMAGCSRGVSLVFFLLLCHPCIMTDPRASLTFQATWPFILVCCCGYSTKVTGWGFAQLCKSRPECKLPCRIN